MSDVTRIDKPDDGGHVVYYYLDMLVCEEALYPNAEFEYVQRYYFWRNVLLEYGTPDLGNTYQKVFCWAGVAKASLPWMRWLFAKEEKLFIYALFPYFLNTIHQRDRSIVFD